MAASQTVVEAVEQVGLHYVSDKSPGITRIRTDSGFAYRGVSGKLLKDPHVLDRIDSLAIPRRCKKIEGTSGRVAFYGTQGIDRVATGPLSSHQLPDFELPVHYLPVVFRRFAVIKADSLDRG